jgi:hypothetical protein
MKVRHLEERHCRLCYGRVLQFQQWDRRRLCGGHCHMRGPISRNVAPRLGRPDTSHATSDVLKKFDVSLSARCDCVWTARDEGAFMHPNSRRRSARYSCNGSLHQRTGHARDQRGGVGMRGVADYLTRLPFLNDFPGVHDSEAIGHL